MRFAICNETFEGWDFDRICRFIAGLGYTGVELAPYTLAPRITDVSQEQRRRLLESARECGLTIVGLHWLLARTEGMQITSTEESVRQRTANYLVDLARCCRDLEGNVLVFGSPAQRRIPAGGTREAAAEFAIDTFRKVLPAIGDCGVKLCLEPLAPAETDFINTCAEAMELIERVGDPNLLLHLDVKAMASEALPVTDLIREFAPGPGTSMRTTPTGAGPALAQQTSYRFFKRSRTANTKAGCRSRCLTTRPTPKRSLARA